jgi:hypothetical protein
MRVFPRHHRYPDLGPNQELPDISHELANPGLAEQLFRMARSHPPVHGQVDGSLVVLLVVEFHKLPERQSTSGCLGPHVFLGQLHEGQIQPGSPCHPAATST